MRPCRTVLHWLLSTLVILAACKPEPKLAHQAQTFQRSYENCTIGTENCTYLKLSFPTFTAGPTAAGLEATNRQILDFLTAPTGEKKSADLEAFARQYFTDYQAFRQQFPKAPQVWTLERSVEVMAETPKILSLSFTEDSYLGGAHPNSNRTLLSLNPATGARYRLRDLLKPRYEAALTSLGEKAFREARQIPPGQSLEDAGFTFDGGAFKLNDNFAASEAGLVFYYNAYEVAAYVFGPTEVTIPYAALKEWILKKGPLKGLAK